MLYNETLYKIKQQWEETGKHDGFNKMYHKIKASENYRCLPADVANHCVREVYTNIKSFYKLLKMKNNGDYHNQFMIPQIKVSIFSCMQSEPPIWANRVHFTFFPIVYKFHRNKLPN